MPEHDPHPWFASTTLTTLTSHNGWYTKKRGQAGSLEAFRLARKQGYRWMQIDAVPIKDDLISGHMGLRALHRNKTFAEIKKKKPHVARILDVLMDDELKDVYWNIELKSKYGVKALLTLLGELKDTGRDMHTIMISSPLRRETLRRVAEDYPEVALAAPWMHGGVFGVRFTGRNRAVVRTSKGERRYDCQQCLMLLFCFPFGRRSPSSKGDRPLRQLWTVCSRLKLHAGAEKKAHMVVESSRVNLPQRDTGRILCMQVGDSNPSKLALGGGGFRGAFGGIGVILYIANKCKWQNVEEIVGISGGAFAVATLAAQPDDNDPSRSMAALLTDLERAGRRIGRMVLYGLAIALPVLTVVVLVVRWAWNTQNPWALSGAVILTLCAASFLLRSFVTIYWRVTLRRLYGSATIRDNRAVPKQDREPIRYRIGATGMSDGNLYSYTSDFATDHEARKSDSSLPIPVPLRKLNGKPEPHKLREAVLRATSLPGVGQYGPFRICIDDHASKKDHSDICRVPDLLVDGGISGIFGRGLITRVSAPPAVSPPEDFSETPTIDSLLDSTQTNADPLLVVVDAGRALQVRYGSGFRDRLLNIVERISTIALLGRWIKIALDVAYRAELQQVSDNERSDGCRCRLVRLAEEEKKGTTRESNLSEQRQLEFNRLSLLRDRVHGFSLLKTNQSWANRAVTVAVAACALELNEDPEQRIEDVLLAIGGVLKQNHYPCAPDDLAEVWNNIPVLGKPVRPTRAAGEGFESEQVELVPAQMRGA